VRAPPPHPEQHRDGGRQGAQVKNPARQRIRERPRQPGGEQTAPYQAGLGAGAFEQAEIERELVFVRLEERRQR